MKSFAPLRFGCQPEKGANTETEIPRNAPAATLFSSTPNRRLPEPTAGALPDRETSGACPVAGRAHQRHDCRCGTHIGMMTGRRRAFRTACATARAANGKVQRPYSLQCRTQAAAAPDQWRRRRNRHRYCAYSKTMGPCDRWLLWVKGGSAERLTGVSEITPIPDVPGSGRSLRLRAKNGSGGNRPNRH